MDALDRAKDVEFLVEPVLGRLVVESAHEYGLVRVTLDLLVRVWMPLTIRRLQAATLPGFKPR